MAEQDCKRCIKCEQLLPLIEFHKSTNYTSGRMNMCRACKKVYAKALSALESPEHRAERLARHRERTFKWKQDNKEWVRAYTARTTAENTKRHRRWREANPERFAVHIFASNHKRRLLKKGGMTGSQTKAWMDAQKKVCHWCGKGCADLPTIDHLIPLSKGGEHIARNLVIACKPCNSKKHAKDPIDFARSLGKLL